MIEFAATFTKAPATPVNGYRGGAYYTPDFAFVGGQYVGQQGALQATLVQAAAINWDASVAQQFFFTAATDAVRVFQVPTNGIPGQSIGLYLLNSSGGPLTQTTFIAAIRQGIFTLPASTKARYFVLTCIDAGAPNIWAFTGSSPDLA